MARRFAQCSTLISLGLGASVMNVPCVDIGLPLSESCIARQKGSEQVVLVTPNQFEPGFEFVYQTIRYTGVVKKGRFVFLSTIDPKFRTPEGVSPSMSLNQLHITPAQMHLIPGWAQVYRLPSGWSCAFAFDAKLKESSNMLFLYKNDSKARF